jgi:hypothetical protein
MNPRSAIILVESAARRDAAALAKLLDFFGIRQRTVFAESASDEDVRWLRDPDNEVVWLASASGMAVAEKRGLINSKSWRNKEAPFQSALIYAGTQPEDLPAVFALLLDSPACELAPSAEEPVTVRFSDRHAGFCGPFSGMTVANVSGAGASFLIGYENKAEAVITAPGRQNAALLAQGQCAGKPVLFSASPGVTGIETLTAEKYFDIKRHLAGLLPFVMFIKQAFAEQRYKADRIKACLIIDDPRLVKTYGHFDYESVFNHARTRDFTANVSFIPWNYRRSRSSVVKLVKSNSDRFSISVHGCDHTKAEFGSTNPSTLEWLAGTANRRMESHREKHSLTYDPVMIFPQGVFSAESAAALKRHNYWAAVNTDICASNDAAGVPISNVMDLAITKYNGFPVVTRRYFWHGMENFAFDMLLEKPCLIVTHQQDFKGGGVKVLEGLASLARLNTKLEWSTLGDVVQTLQKRQRVAVGHESVRLYAHDNLVANNSPNWVEASFTKTEPDPAMLDAVMVDGKRVNYSASDNACVFSCRLNPGQKVRLQFQYKKDVTLPPFQNTLVRQAKVTLRRHLTEIRDRYLS